MAKAYFHAGFPSLPFNALTGQSASSAYHLTPAPTFASFALHRFSKYNVAQSLLTCQSELSYVMSLDPEGSTAVARRFLRLLVAPPVTPSPTMSSHSQTYSGLL